MISFLRGEPAEITPESIVIDVNGVGYEVFIPLRLYDELCRRSEAAGNGGEIRLYTHMQVREDDVSLYGFATREERGVFRMLIGVSGIGPKGALGILSGLSVEQLRFAVLTDDAKTIAKAPGVGRKTAQKLILELRDKISKDDLLPQETVGALEGADMPSGAAAQQQSVIAETVMALTALGFTNAEAARAVRALGLPPEETEAMGAERLLKLALKQLT